MNLDYLLLPLRRRDGTLAGHAIIDAADAALAEHRWHLHSRGYVARRPIIGGVKRTLFLHRVILGLVPGDGLQGDHVNGNPLDCRRSNLRVGTNALNGQNIERTGGTSAHRGVGWDAERGRWQARAELNGRRVFLGRFDDEQAAAEAARAFRVEHMPFANEARHGLEAVSDAA